jgi:hypothetical protein
MRRRPPHVVAVGPPGSVASQLYHRYFTGGG